MNKFNHNKMFKSALSVIITFSIVFSSFSFNAYADSENDPTGFGVNDMSYGMAKIAVPLMNGVFDVVNLLSGAVEIWSCLDGKVYKNLSYGEYDVQKYDLYIPHGLDKSQPQGVLLFIHGGTWTMGKKEHMAWAAARFAKRGYISVTMNYNLASQGNDDVAKATGSKPDADVFDMLNDVTLCISSVNKRLNELGYVADSLALSGVSAGSHIAALYTYSRYSESEIPIKMLFNITTPVGFHNGTFDNYSPAEVAQYASIVAGEIITEENIINPDDKAEALLNSISPVSHINENSVPTLLGFAGKDKTIGTNQFNTIKPVLDKYEVENDVIWWKNSDHTLMLDPFSMLQWTAKVSEWLEIYM